MYMTSGAQPFAGGTASAGITAPALQWFIAEGATGAFFDLFILIGNPSTGPAAVTITYLLPNGTTVEKTHTVAGRESADHRREGRGRAARGHRRVRDDHLDQRHADRRRAGDVVAEPDLVRRHRRRRRRRRPPPAGRWPAATSIRGRTPRPTCSSPTPARSAANVTIDVGQRPSPDPTFPAARLPRHGVRAGARPLHGRRQGPMSGDGQTGPAEVVTGTITSDGPPIVVERSTYWSTADQFWAAGASTLLTPLP